MTHTKCHAFLKGNSEQDLYRIVMKLLRMNQIQKTRVAWGHWPQDIAFRVSVWVLFVKLNSTMRWLNVKTPYTRTHIHNLSTHAQRQAYAQIACQRRRSEQRNKVDYNNIAQKARHKTYSQTPRQRSRRRRSRIREKTTTKKRQQ